MILFRVWDIVTIDEWLNEMNKVFGIYPGESAFLL